MRIPEAEFKYIGDFLYFFIKMHHEYLCMLIFMHVFNFYYYHASWIFIHFIRMLSISNRLPIIHLLLNTITHLHLDLLSFPTFCFFHQTQINVYRFVCLYVSLYVLPSICLARFSLTTDATFLSCPLLFSLASRSF